MKRTSILAFVMVLFLASLAENPDRVKKHSFFIGPQPDYHRIYIGIRFPQTYYFRSDLRLFGPAMQPDSSIVNFDVTLNKIAGHDDGFVYSAWVRTIFHNAQAPPYVVAFGYKVKNSNFGVAGRIIHYKYFMRQDRDVEINGTVGTDTYTGYHGTPPFLLNYENTDGHNIYSLGMEFTCTVKRSKNEKHWLDVSGMVGPGISYPRTEAKVVTPDGYELHRNNDFKVAGGGMVLESCLSGTVCHFLTFTLEMDLTVIRNSNMYIISNGLSDLRGAQTISAFSWSTGMALTFPFKPFRKINHEKAKPTDASN